MIHNLYIIVVVLLRLIALYLVAKGLFAWALTLAIAGGHFEAPLLALLFPVLGGIALWYLARPCARLVTQNLE